MPRLLGRIDAEAGEVDEPASPVRYSERQGSEPLRKRPGLESYVGLPQVYRKAAVCGGGTR